MTVKTILAAKGAAVSKSRPRLFRAPTMKRQQKKRENYCWMALTTL